MKNPHSWISNLLRKEITKLLNKFSYVHVDSWTRPYIIKKNIEGVEFLLSIRDLHARLWYDLYSTDPVWIEMRFIRDHLLHSGDVVIECGSHHGCTAILLANWVGPKGRVHAFEPGKVNFEVLEENIKLNGMANINAINEAVGNENSLVNFIESSAASMGSRVDYGEDNKNNAINYKIKQVSLDEYLSVRPDLIKIDTQGYVYQTLLGAKNIIAEQKPNLAIEIDGKDVIEKYGKNFEKMFEIIDQDDYTFFVQFEEFEEPKRILLSDLLTEWDKRNNFSKDIHLFAKNLKRFQ